MIPGPQAIEQYEANHMPTVKTAYVSKGAYEAILRDAPAVMKASEPYEHVYWPAFDLVIRPAYENPYLDHDYRARLDVITAEAPQ